MHAPASGDFPLVVAAKSLEYVLELVQLLGEIAEMRVALDRQGWD
jgi:hypothetical protein